MEKLLVMRLMDAAKRAARGKAPGVVGRPGMVCCGHTSARPRPLVHDECFAGWATRVKV